VPKRLVHIVGLFCFATAASAFAAPQRAMSINLCSDQMLLDLLPPDRIASVTYNARQGYGSYLAEKAKHVAVNHGTAEEVVAQRPDLVVAGLYTATATRALLRRVGIPMIELPPAEDFATIRENMRTVARAVGEEGKAEALLGQMDATLAELAATAPERPIVIAGWDGSGEVPGPKTLFNAIITAAGAINVAASYGGGEGYTKFPLEQLLFSHVDLLAHGDSYTMKPALRSQSLQHPAVRALYAGREITYPQLLYSCGLPQSADAAKQLRHTMMEVLAKTGAKR